MISLPVEELKNIRKDTHLIPVQSLTDVLNLNDEYGLTGSLVEIELELSLQEGGNFGIMLSNSFGDEYHIGYDGVNNEYFSDRIKAGNTEFSKEFAKQAHTAPRIRKDKNLKMHLFFDTASAELFADNGEVVLTDIYFPGEPFTSFQFYSNSPVEIKSGAVYSLNSIWNKE